MTISLCKLSGRICVTSLVLFFLDSAETSLPSIYNDLLLTPMERTDICYVPHTAFTMLISNYKLQGLSFAKCSTAQVGLKTAAGLKRPHSAKFELTERWPPTQHCAEALIQFHTLTPIPGRCVSFDVLCLTARKLFYFKIFAQ